MKNDKNVLGVTSNAFFTMSSDDDYKGDLWGDSCAPGSCVYDGWYVDRDGRDVLVMTEYTIL